MKLATLKKLERGYYALMIALEKERRSDSASEELYQGFVKAWMHWREKFQAADNAAWAKKDKGQVLFTIFVPDRNCIVERIRTPNRIITVHHWKRGWPVTTHYETSDKPHAEVLRSKFERQHYTPEYHFTTYMKGQLA